ncbi:enoyl-CoA hydratase/isomerase family protein [Alteromonas sp. H39]|uniref:enoyl-CoA hydratase/isomerase family protein n=1 Tax=Alteromonas sp. H39 TaxID=3389876 RepID=UPI0039E1261C
MSEDAEALPVLISEADAGNGKKVGILTLNKPKALNALDLAMAELMLDALKDFATREDIACVFIDAEGEKAFCAGGDVVSMHEAMLRDKGAIPAFLKTFFSVEYTLDYTIRTFNKPIIVWGTGIVMGGGMGLMSGASHRIVTETSRLAMPEITIGLYPDVGGSYFLPRLPGKSGLFLGLTGASMNAGDARYLGLADHFVTSDKRQQLLDTLCEQAWQDDDVDEQVAGVINSLSDADEMPASVVETHQSLIDDVCSHDSLPAIVDAINAMDSADDKWLARAQKTLAGGSPITAHLVYQQCQRGAHMSLADCFRMELIMSCRCGEAGEFQEGVRALLIDKDNSPNWKYASVAEVPDAVVDTFFTSPWDSASHPLTTLGE